MTGQGHAIEEEIGELSDDAIAGSWRIWQRVRGHRYSIDDVATAWEAAQVGAGAGARIGSPAPGAPVRAPGALPYAPSGSSTPAGARIGSPAPGAPVRAPGALPYAPSGSSTPAGAGIGSPAPGAPVRAPGALPYAPSGSSTPAGARSVLDLGCGIGSVTLMLAYALRDARIVGIEAQAISIELARRNVERNGLGDRVSLVHGDLREVAPALEARFDLVTGTPPYFDPAKSSPSTDSQRTHARIEMRGGIEAYLLAGAPRLAPGGRMVVCGDSRRPDRVLAGAASAGLTAIARRDVVPREGKGALFTIWTLAPKAEREGEVHVEEREALIARDASGARTEHAHALRRFFDLVVNDAEAASPPLRERRAR